LSRALPKIVSLLGSPSPRSRSGALLAQLEARLVATLDDDTAVDRIALRDLPPAALLAGDAAEPSIARAVAAVREARLVLVATPIYKAAYSGLLKAFLDLLPQDALRGKTVVPLATGGSIAHLLALDYALKPVLGALGAHDIRAPVFATDAQLPADAGTHTPVLDLQQRLDRTVGELIAPVAAGWWSPREVEAGAVQVLSFAQARAPAIDARCTA
jgi:FMN reductase